MSINENIIHNLTHISESYIFVLVPCTRLQTIRITCALRSIQYVHLSYFYLCSVTQNILDCRCSMDYNSVFH